MCSHHEELCTKDTGVLQYIWPSIPTSGLTMGHWWQPDSHAQSKTQGKWDTTLQRIVHWATLCGACLLGFFLNDFIAHVYLRIRCQWRLVYCVTSGFCWLSHPSHCVTAKCTTSKWNKKYQRSYFPVLAAWLRKFLSLTFFFFPSSPHPTPSGFIRW